MNQNNTPYSRLPDSGSRGITSTGFGVRMVITFGLGFILFMLATIAHTSSSNFNSNPVLRNTLLAKVKSLPIIDNPKVKYVYMTHSDKTNLFENFMIKYGKLYKNIDEEDYRFNIFKNNLAIIDDLNLKSAHALYDINEFSDMTTEEFSKYKLGYDNSKSGMLPGEVVDWDDSQCSACKRFPELAEITMDNLPESFDWEDYGAVTPVKNQAMCGSCWAFSTVQDIEGSWYLAGHNLTELSEQQLVACDSNLNSGCNGGLPLLAMQYIEKAGGLVSANDYPYKKVNQYVYSVDTPTCDTDVVQKSNYVAHIKSWQKIASSAEDEEKLALALIRSGPLSLALDASGMEYYSSGIDDYDGCTTSLNHAVLLTGFGVESGVKYWKIKNSWGYWWGESGYYRIIKGINKCGLSTEVVHSLI